MWPDPIVTPRSLSPMPTTFIVRRPIANERPAMDLVALAWLAVLGFAMGVSGVALICAIAQRPWL